MCPYLVTFLWMRKEAWRLEPRVSELELRERLEWMEFQWWRKECTLFYQYLLADEYGHTLKIWNLVPWCHCVHWEPWEQEPKHTLTEYRVVIQIIGLLKCMLSHTGDLGSRLDTLDDIDTEKTVHIPRLLHCS